MKPEKKKRNIAKVAYKVDGEVVRIIGFQRFLTMKGIEEKYGLKVAEVYFKKTPHMVLTEEGKVCISDDNGLVDIDFTFLYQMDNFQKILTIMRAAGANLVSAIKAQQIHIAEI